MKVPLATTALIYVAGIIAGEWVSFPIGGLIAIGFILLALSIWRRTASMFSLAALMFVTGLANHAAHTRIISPQDIRVHLEGRSEEVTVRGKLSEVSERHYETKWGEKWRSLARVELTALHSGGAWKPAHGKILVTTGELLGTNFTAGQRVEVSGVIKEPRAALAESLFDYRTFLRRQGIYYQLEARSVADWKTDTTAPGPTTAEHFILWAKKALHAGIPEDEALHLTWAMTLGWKTGLTDESSEAFMQSGTMHIFAISGLHIALFAAIFIQLLRFLRVPRVWCGAIVIPVIWFYTAATGWQPSAIRSTIMMTIVIGGWALKRPANLLNSLGAAAFIILLWEPQQLFQASFQLSFFVVLSIALLLPTFELFRKRITSHDEFLPPELLPPWQRVLDTPTRWFTTSLVTSLAAWIGSIPLVAYYFHLFTPVSLLANMLVVPLSSLALMSNVGTLLSFGWFPPLAELFNHAGWFFMQAMVHSSERFAATAGAYFYVPEPTTFDCIVFYVIVFSALSGWLFAAKRRAWTIITVSVVAAGWFGYWTTQSSNWKITILPFEGGETVFVDAPGKKNDLLIDCGNESTTDRVTTPFLHGQGVNHLPALLLTHGDLKNIGGTSNIISDFKITNVIASSLKFRSPTYRHVQNWLSTRDDLRRNVHRGDKIAGWNVLHPAATDKFSQADDGPIILHGDIHGTRILLLSDLSRSSQHLLWDRTRENLRADIVVAGLPRESEPLNDALIQTIQPKLIVITDSDFPATERASTKLRERLTAHNIPVIFGRDAGAITFTLSDQKCVVQQMNQPERLVLKH